MTTEPSNQTAVDLLTRERHEAQQYLEETDLRARTYADRLDTLTPRPTSRATYLRDHANRDLRRHIGERAWQQHQEDTAALGQRVQDALDLENTPDPHKRYTAIRGRLRHASVRRTRYRWRPELIDLAARATTRPEGRERA